MLECHDTDCRARVGLSRPQRWMRVGFRPGQPRRGSEDLGNPQSRDPGLSSGPRTLPDTAPWNPPGWWF